MRRRHEPGFWQRRFWEHLIRDDDDLHRHLDYIHFNAVKHGMTSAAADWPHSSFHGYVKRGVLPLIGKATGSILRQTLTANDAIEG